MLDQALGSAPNFFNITFFRTVRVQVGSLSGKYALFATAMQNQQCPVRPLILPLTFPKWPLAFLLGLRLGS
jgi:hypothetical protein